MSGEIRLADFIDNLREELIVAIGRGAKSPVRFKANSVDLELQVVAEQKVGKNGKVSFTVFGIGAEGGGDRSTTSQSVQKVSLSLALVDAHGKSPLISAPPDESQV